MVYYCGKLLLHYYSAFFCIVLYCIILYCLVLYCIVLSCLLLYPTHCIVLYWIVLYSIAMNSIVLFCNVMQYTVSYYGNVQFFQSSDFIIHFIPNSIIFGPILKWFLLHIKWSCNGIHFPFLICFLTFFLIYFLIFFLIYFLIFFLSFFLSFFC